MRLASRGVRWGEKAGGFAFPASLPPSGKTERVGNLKYQFVYASEYMASKEAGSGSITPAEDRAGAGEGTSLTISSQLVETIRAMVGEMLSSRRDAEGSGSSGGAERCGRQWQLWESWTSCFWN